MGHSLVFVSIIQNEEDHETKGTKRLDWKCITQHDLKGLHMPGHRELNALWRQSSSCHTLTAI